MASLKEVKSRISSIISTQQITKAMKMVAAAKLRKSQDRIVQMRPFAEKLSEVLKNVSGASDDGQSWYSAVREPNNVVIVVVSADRGL
ncbi:MAG TPA: FoF1 ATP synthase subunit gamma, partial [Cyclobacteriaceae bacterium]|nr:FoF1 ATP synthase subunit gamma [Cyclobacteriaceae bacterium]